jgi:hypothetical protein
MGRKVGSREGHHMRAVATWAVNREKFRHFRLETSIVVASGHATSRQQNVRPAISKGMQKKNEFLRTNHDPTPTVLNYSN